ncbi:hypothetical protein H5T56_03395 [Candidatus Bipolaricaulota bacterium]|nr:hypothetical protein [Candidatus Bipolaricaulota bacterium]
MRALALLGQVGFIVAGGAFVGYGLGWLWDRGHGGRLGQALGIVLGLAGGAWAALRLLLKEGKRGGPEP